MIMITKINCFKNLFGCLFILLHVSAAFADLSVSVAKIFGPNGYLCAGTLIKDRYLVTAGDCLRGIDEANQLLAMGNGKHVVRSDLLHVSDIFRSSYYDKNATDHPYVAVLKLKESNGGRYLKSAELCNLKCVTVGEPFLLYVWNGMSHLRVKDIIRPYRLNVIDEATCKNKYRNSFTESSFCGADKQYRECFEGMGAPAEFQGQFCGVYSSTEEFSDKNSPGILISLTDPNIQQFINEVTTDSTSNDCVE